MHLNIQEKILSGFGAVMFLATVMVAGAYVSLAVIQDVVQSLSPSEIRRDKILEVQELVYDVEKHVEQYLTVSGEEYRDHTADDNALLAIKVHELLKLLDQSGLGKPEQRAIMAEESAFESEVYLLLSLDLHHESAGVLNNQILNTYARLHNLQVTVEELAVNSRKQVEAQIAEVGQIVKQTILRVLLFMFILLLSAIGISIYIARTLTKPTLALISTAKKFSLGDHSTRAVVMSHDEIGELAVVFNEMAGTLESYTEGLEAQVSTRTKELDEKISTLNAANAELDNRASLLQKRGEELTLANAKLHELDRIKSEFLSIAAHQLRTPLSAVKWIFSVLLEGHMGALAPEQKGYLIKGEESNNRMIRLVDDMLTVTRIESGKTKFTFYMLSLEEVLKNTVADFQPRAKDKGLTLTYTQADGTFPKVQIDPEKIRFIFENLLENAIRYTPKGGSITVSLSRESELLVVSVIDTGIGIPENEHKNIFSKFFRATNAVKTVTDGSGLGLFVAKSVAAHHGGELTFTSKVGVGTTFKVTLPPAKDANKTSAADA